MTPARSYPSQGAWSPCEAIGLAATLGVALYTSGVFALYLCGLSGGDAAFLALPPALCVLLLGGRALRTARRGEAAPDGGGPRAAIVAGSLVMVAQVAFAAYGAVRAPFGSWDAWSFWALKARMFAAGGPLPGYFHDPVTVYTHPDYPLNLPLAEAAFLRVPGPIGVVTAGLVGVALFAGLLLLFYHGLRRLYGRVTAALGTAILALVPALPLQAAGGDADAPVAAYAGAAALYLLLWWRKRRVADALLAGLLAGGAAWTKREGLPIAVLVLLALAAGEAVARDRPARGRIGAVAGATLAGALVSAPWLTFVAWAHPIGTDFLPLTPAVLLSNAGRAPHITLRFLLETCVIGNWSLLWVLLAAILVMAALSRRLSAQACGLLLLLAAQFGVYASVYLFSGWASYTLHIQASIDRLYAQAVPLAVLALVEATQGLPFRGRFFTKEGGAEGTALRDTPRAEGWVASRPTPPHKSPTPVRQGLRGRALEIHEPTV